MITRRSRVATQNTANGDEPGQPSFPLLGKGWPVRRSAASAFFPQRSHWLSQSNLRRHTDLDEDWAQKCLHQGALLSDKLVADRASRPGDLINPPSIYHSNKI